MVNLAASYDGLADKTCARPGSRTRCGAVPGRLGRLRELPERRGRGAGPRRLPGADLRPAGRRQAPLRAHQPVPPEPEHPPAAYSSRAEDAAEPQVGG